MGRFIDITGQRFGRLVVVEKDGARDGCGNILWSCKCDCGNTLTTSSANLRRHLTKSCGCYKLEINRKQFLGNELRLKHGHNRAGRSTSIYRAWQGAMQRCYKTYEKSYPSYGGRGITVCRRWWKFENFLVDMGEKPTTSHSLDRIDNDGNYCPSNCRWATSKQQTRNRRNNTLLTHNKQTMCIAEWGEHLGIDRKVILGRLKMGWSVKRTLTTPATKYRRKTNGKN